MPRAGGDCVPGEGRACTQTLSGRFVTLTEPSMAGRLRPEGRGRGESDPARPLRPLKGVPILLSVPWEGTEKFKQRFHFKNVIWATG